MSPDVPTAVVAEGSLSTLREIQSALRARGLDGEIVRPPPAQCSS